MKFKLTDFKLPARIYAVYLFETGLTEREFLAIAAKLRYYANMDGVSWLAVYSSTESATAQSKPQNNGKRGRPKKFIYGKKTNPHCHLSLVGTKEKSAYNTAVRFKKSVDKKRGKKICRVVSKGDSFDARIWVGYSLKQADFLRSGGDFDFQSEAIIL